MKNALIVALVAASLPAFAGTPAKNPVTPPPPAPAAGFSYDNVSLAYTAGFNNSDHVSDGLSAAVNVSITDMIFGYAGLGFSGDGSLDDVFSARAGAGAHFALVAGKLDAVLTAGAVYVDVDAGDEDFAFQGGAALRAFLGPIDTTLGVNYTDLGDGVWTGNVSFWIPVASKLDVGVGAGLNLEETDFWSLSGGIRYRF